MRVKETPLSDIRPYPGNPRVNDGAVEAVAASIREFGFQQPIVCDADGTIIAGHTRYKAAQALGLETVPVVYATDLAPEQVNAYRLADNKTAELAEWDADMLAVELDGLSAFCQCEQLMADAGAEQLFDRSVPDQFFQPGAGKPRCVKSGDTCSGAAGVVTVDPDSGSFERLKHAGGGLDLAASAARDHGENGIGHDKFSC